MVVTLSEGGLISGTGVGSVVARVRYHPDFSCSRELRMTLDFLSLDPGSPMRNHEDPMPPIRTLRLSPETPDPEGSDGKGEAQYAAVTAFIIASSATSM